MPQVDYFLKIEGVDGESKDARHPGEIELASFNWGETNSGSGGDHGGAGFGKTIAQDLQFAKRVDKASPKLFIACATGEHFKKAVLIGRRAGAEQQEFLKLTLEDLSVTAYQLGGATDSGTVPMDQVALRFAKLEVSYRSQKNDGSLDAEIKQRYNFATRKNE
jgi:type VI secretion system secreted protein Hcp